MPDLPLIPRPLAATRLDGAWTFPERCTIAADRQRVGSALACLERALLAHGIASTVAAEAPAIVLALVAEDADGLGDEGYVMDIGPARIELRSAAPAGLFHGVQTLQQLLALHRAQRRIPCLRLRDRPRFAIRSFMLDSARRFLPVARITALIEAAAGLKLNTFHWHLTDDEGWRLELRSHPRLTIVGAFLGDDASRHGFYTQAEVAEVVAFAAARHITVIPEIDVPGHSFAAVSAYPELCCTGRPQRNEGHSSDLYCAGDERTFAVLGEVLAEVCALFPGPYVHIGGDEAPKEHWLACAKCQQRMASEGLASVQHLQGYFCARIAATLRRHGKRMIGWEEILDGGPSLPPEAIVHWWRRRTRGDAYLRQALERGHDVLASPNNLTYLNFPVDPDAHFSPERTIDLREAYLGDYLPGGGAAGARGRVLGGGLCLWMDVMADADLDRHLFPRALAIAERLWSPADVRDFSDFHQRVLAVLPLLQAQGFAHGPAFRRSVASGPVAAQAARLDALDG